MFSRIYHAILYFLLVGSLFAAATTTVTVGPKPTSTPAGDCSVSKLECCQSTTPADSDDASKILGLLGIVVQGVNVIVGLNCVPISIVGIENGACSASPVCCENNDFNGLINIGCVPITL